MSARTKPTVVLPAAEPTARVRNGGQDMWRVGNVMVTTDRHIRVGQRTWSPAAALQLAANLAAAAALATARPTTTVGA